MNFMICIKGHIRRKYSHCFHYYPEINRISLLIKLYNIKSYMVNIKLALVLLTFLILAASTPCKIKQNNRMLVHDEPVLIDETTNGQKMLIGDLNDPEGNYLYVAKLKGTPHEMGKAYGQLFKEEIKQNFDAFYNYYLGQLEDLLINASLPKFMAKGLTNSAHSLALRLLDINIMITKKYTHPRYFEQIAGIAAGAKMASRDISRVNIIPEVIKAACTVAGVWNQAALDGHTLHVRSLDWDAKSPISKYPVIAVYQPSDEKYMTHANVAWAGFVGVLTGMSPKLTIGEKVWYPKFNSVKTTRYGNPWNYVLRDVLYDATNLLEAIGILSNAHRTCTIHLGLGSKDDRSFRMFNYAQKQLDIFNDQNYTGYNQDYHPKRPGIAYFDKDIQPSKNECVGHVLTYPQIYGKWEIESLWRILGLSHETGDTQHVVFDLTDQKMMVSYSRQTVNEKNETITEKAYERSPILVDMQALWEKF